MAKDLREFLSEIEERYPEELLRVEKEVNPADFEVTAILQHLEPRQLTDLFRTLTIQPAQFRTLQPDHCLGGFAEQT